MIVNPLIRANPPVAEGKTIAKVLRLVLVSLKFIAHILFCSDNPSAFSEKLDSTIRYYTIIGDWTLIISYYLPMIMSRLINTSTGYPFIAFNSAGISKSLPTSLVLLKYSD